MLAAIQLMCVGISAASEQSCDAFPDNPTPAVIATTCKEFCNNKCAFLNSSAGKMGLLLLSFLSFFHSFFLSFFILRRPVTAHASSDSSSPYLRQHLCKIHRHHYLTVSRTLSRVLPLTLLSFFFSLFFSPRTTFKGILVCQRLWYCSE